MEKSITEEMRRKSEAKLMLTNEQLVFRNKENEKRIEELLISIKELNQSEKKLLKNLEEVSEYTDILNNATIITLTDKNGNIKTANSNFCKISKYSEEELVGINHRIFNSGEHSKAFMADLWQTITAGKIWKGEIKNKAKDGSFYWVNTTIVPFLNKENETYQYLAIREDITKCKESEKQLKFINEDLVVQNENKTKLAVKLNTANYARSLIEASRDPLFTISPEGKITDINNATLSVTGKSRKDLIGSYFSQYFTQPVKAKEGYEKVFEEGFVIDYPLTIVDGTKTDVLFNGSVYTDDKGNVLGAVVVARDITEQKRVEKELTEAKVLAELATTIAEEAKAKAEKATQIAENAVKAKQQFLSNMSHEIRTPMNAIIGFTKVVLKTDLNAKQKEYLTAIKISGDALIVLINDILDLAKVDAGKMVFEQSPFKLKRSIASMLHLFEIKIQEKNLTLIRKYDDRIPEVLIGDSVRLHQIIMNLVSNAVKFTSNGSITLSVQMLEEDNEKVSVQFDIKDTGIGIDENKLNNIFDDFQQATSGTSRLYGGTGLGLAIAKQLIEPQGGSINVTSALGIGSTFSFILPFFKTNNEDIIDCEYIELDPVIKQIKVLVVEDIPLNQLLMKTLLDDLGFERDIAENGLIAVEKLKNKNYDVILMDLQMPIMSGFAATEYIRNVMHSKTPIIALTADVTTVDLEKCKAVGMNDYLAKPVDERILYSKIINLVHQAPKLIDGDELDIEISESCIDLEYLNKRTKSNPKLMMEMISLYLEQTPALINAMNSSFIDKDWETLNSAIHKMIPSFSIVGIAIDYVDKARIIQEFAETQQQVEDISILVGELDKVCSQACKELKHELNKLEKLSNENE